MNRHSAAVVFLACVSVYASHVWGYDLLTHALLSQHAFDQSQRLRSYLEDTALGADDVFDPDNRARQSASFAGFDNTGRLRDWIAAGAIREDDYQRHPTVEFLSCPPPQNPPSSIDRPLRHFFDVQRRGAGLPGGIAAPAWALGLEGRGPSEAENHFALPDARVYQLRSLIDPDLADRQRNTALLFRTLGDVIHVLQDMAQPQHTRNDPHAGCDSSAVQLISGEKSWYEDYVERRATGARYRGRDVNDLPLTGYAVVSLSNYLDYWSNTKASGLADFSSRSFFSAGTNLGTFYLAGPCGGLLEPICNSEAYATEDMNVAIPTLGGETLIGSVRFFLRRVVDRLTDQVIRDVRVSSRSFWDEHLEARRLLPKFALNRFNYDAMADILVPRAVGYSAGLLDYFFRGRLDGDVVLDPADPTLVRFTGSNASPEAMDGGTLELYAEDADGLRTRLTPHDSDLTVFAAAGARVQSARFEIAPDAEGFVAVYHGTLGTEAPIGDSMDPRGSPGAVVGKVLGGLRVEEVFSDGTTWRLRTPDGIFALPISAATVRDLRWGDRDNTLVGRTAFGRTGQPNTFFAWQLSRPEGSPTVPLTEAGEVSLQLLHQAVFPAGLALGTTVQLDHTIRFQMYLPRYLRNGESFAFENPLEVNVTERLGRVFPLALDLDKLNNFRAVPHSWSLGQIGLTRDNRIVALVTSTLTSPGVTAPVTRRVYKTPCGTWPCPILDVPGQLVFQFPNSGRTALVAVVDVTNGRVVASTAPETMILTHTTFQTDVGGATDDRSPVGLVAAQPTGDGFFVLSDAEPGRKVFAKPCIPVGPVIDLGAVMHEFGEPVAQTTAVRPELAAATFAPRINRDKRTIFGCVSDIDSVPGEPEIVLTRNVDSHTAFYNSIDDVRRSHAAPDRLVLTASQVYGFADLLPGFSVQVSDRRVIRWDPSAPTAATRHAWRDAEPADMSVLGVSRDTALLGRNLLRSHTTELVVVPLASDQPVASFPMEPSGLTNFTALEPNRIYNTNDQKFYKPLPALERTALPRALAAGGSATGNYHTLTLR